MTKMILTTLLLLASSHWMVAIAQQNTSCPTSSSAAPILPTAYHIDIFDHIVSLEPAIADAQVHAPWIQGIDITAPAYEFAGMGSGFAITSLSEKIRTASCTHNEVTFTGHVFIRNSKSDGPLIELSYAGGLENGLAIYLLHMDAAADEFVLAYRHQGHLHSESIPVRLLSGRWRDYAVRLSGNLLSFYFDCELLEERIVPLPDYCANDSTIVLNVASSIHGAIEYSGQTGLYIYTQGLGIHFGPGGIQRQCPNAPEICPTCGQFFSLLERLSDARDELSKLQDRVEELESAEGFACPTAPPTPDTGVAPLDCLMEVDSQQRVLQNEEFLLLPNLVCYCDNGRSVCASVDASNVNFPTPPPCSEATSPPDPSNSNDDPEDDVGTCNIFELGEEIREGELVSDRQDSFEVPERCRIFSCESTIVGLTVRRNTVDCVDYSADSCTSYDDFDTEASKCCRICDACDFTTCPNNSVCETQDSPTSPAVCVCLPGFSRTVGGDCVDIDECSIGGVNQACQDNSECENTVGSHTCTCFPGYSEAVDNQGTVTCEDDNECLDETHDCTGASECFNTKGSFECQCLPNYAKTEDDPVCRPVCDPPCQNGGVCSEPGNCTCLPEYTGPRCGVDVDECNDSSLNTCQGLKKVCVNTVGGYFCRCEAGYQERDSQCQDVDECSLPIHNCINSATCINTFGGYKCFCRGEDGLQTDCTGSCIRRGVLYAHGESQIDNCRNCTCFGGEMTCRKIKCDCNNLDQLPAEASECCSECNRRDCVIMDGAVRIRPDSTWINPSNRCERYNCFQNLTAVYVDYSLNCPKPDCPERLQTTPVGKCCPVCMLPTCEGELEGRTVSLRNGCEVCTCQNSKWSCEEEECPPVNCDPKDIVFNKRGCCPVCRHTVLGYSLVQTLEDLLQCTTS